MFNSIHSRRIINWLRGKRKYIVNINICYNGAIIYSDIEVNAFSKAEATKKATEEAYSNIKISCSGLRSLGKVKKFEEIN